MTRDSGAAQFHVGLDLRDRVVTAVGGTPSACELVREAAAAGAIVRWFATTVDAQASTPILLIDDRPFTDADLDDSWLAIAGSEDLEANRVVVAAALRRRIFCLEPNVPAKLGGPTRRPGGSVALVGGGPGALDLITVRGHRLLAEADVVLVDRLAPRGLLAELPATVEVIDCGKAPHGHNMRQDDINDALVEHARAGRRVVRLKGGDPFVFGRGGEEYLACQEAGIPVEVVPGVSSALAAPALAGIPVTHRKIAGEFTVVAGHLDPTRPNPEIDWARLGPGSATLVILMGMERLEAICGSLMDGGRSPDTPAAVVHEASCPGEQVLRAPLAELAATARYAGLGSPSVVVIGDVVQALSPDAYHNRSAPDGPAEMPKVANS